jgi:Phage minor capsid protein 2
MPDQRQLSALLRRIVSRYEDAEATVVRTVALAVGKGIDGDPAQLLRAQLLQRTAIRYEMRRLVRELRAAGEADVAELLTSAYHLSEGEASRVLAVAGEAPLKNEIAATALTALVKDLDTRLTLAESRILRSADDAYRDVIARVTAEGLLGKTTRRQAAQAALNAFADRGVPVFIDSAKRSWSLASYAEMATRTAVIGAGRTGKLDAMRSRGHDLAIISGNTAGCEACAPWEGVVVSIDGATPDYPTLADAEGEGLFHPNCGHQADPYVPGLTEEQTVNRSDPEAYAALQQQRYLERGVRQYKMRAAAAADDPAAAAAAQAKVREWQARLRKHVSANDLPRLYYREQIGKAI